MSETIRLGMILAVTGGFMDAYSYIERDQVFANAQTILEPNGCIIRNQRR